MVGVDQFDAELGRRCATFVLTVLTQDHFQLLLVVRHSVLALMVVVSASFLDHFYNYLLFLILW